MIFYIDMRTIDRHWDYYREMLGEERCELVRGRVTLIEEDAATHDLVLDVDHNEVAVPGDLRFDLVILATGMVPNTADSELPLPLEYDEYGFVDSSSSTPGVFPVGCTLSPCDVATSTRASTAAALRAIQCVAGAVTGD
jgi:quinone-modifying oxidoreductase subunit QmoA